MGAQCCLLAGLAVLANAGAGQRELEKTCNKIQAGPCKLLTNHKTTLPQVWIRWRRKGKGPKFGPGVEWYGGDAAAWRVPVLLAADRPSALSTEIINCNLNYENHEDLQHNVLK